MRTNFELLLGALWRIRLLSLLVVACCSSSPAQYSQTNLVSDLFEMASATDTNLMGAWGMAHSPTGPWAVTTTFGGVALMIDGTGRSLPRVVTVPQTKPIFMTGIAYNGGTGFQVAPGIPASFIMATLNGTILGWSASQRDPSAAVVKVNHSGTAGYGGLSLARNRGQDFLYVANFQQDRLDVFDSNFNAVAQWSGAFKDKQIAAELAPFNVQAISNLLYVTYAPTNVFSGGLGPGRGFVSVFNLDGVLIRGLQYGFWMNCPWGVVQAPANFGHLSNRLLVGMFGSGVIAAFDPANGQFVDFLRDKNLLPLVISRGLWQLEFGNGAAAGPADTLYFATDFQFGVNFYGLIGTLTPARIQ
jgi:uncharacterized protein (TIGR03118 family)